MNKEIKEALDKRNNLDCEALKKLNDLLTMTNYNPGRQKFLEIIAEYNDCDILEAEQIVKEAEDIVKDREKANEEFLNHVRNSTLNISLKEK